jgi:hypothetical protein
MRQISATWTPVFKRVVTWFPFVCLAPLWLGVRIAFGPLPYGAIAVLCISALSMGALWYFVMRQLIWPLMDEAFVDSETIIVRNYGQEDRFLASEVFSVSSTMMMIPEQITLRLKRSRVFGEKIKFIPPLRGFPFPRHPVAKDLAELADAYLTYL